MFETDNSSGVLTRILQYLLQLLTACPLIILVSDPFSAVLRILGLSGEHSSHTHFAGYEGIACMFVGIVVGWFTGRKTSAFVLTGRWIWVLPAIVTFPDMIRQGLNLQPVPRLPEEFFATGGNEGLGVVLFMFPTFSAIGYSIGMALVGTKPRWARLTRHIPLPHAATITVVGFLPFTVLALSAHTFERSRIEKWSRIRTVIERPGLSLSADANQLCSARTSGDGLLLPIGTMVEGLERRVCSGNRVLDKNVQRSADSWSVERVRVLTGSNGGVEGWVPAYGLLEELQN